MEYLVVLLGKTYDLPRFTTKINKQLEDVQRIVLTSDSADRSLRAEYDFISRMLGNESMAEVIGAYDDADPNMINLAYSKIAKAFNKPYMDYLREEESEKVSPETKAIINQMREIINGLPKSK